MNLRLIEGVVEGAQPGEQNVLYAKSGQWWIQPLVTHPFTKLVVQSRAHEVDQCDAA